MKKRERLGDARSPDGTGMTLWRHDGDYTIRVGAVELMSTRRHHSEDALAELACAALHDRAGARVLIGGLGLGFTLRAALRLLPADAHVVVAELVEEIVEWNRTYGLADDALRDPRVELRHADVADVLRASRGEFDAILLDVDNGPDALTSSGNAQLYRATGIAAAVGALRKGGRLAYWSSSDDPGFADALRDAGLTVETTRVRAHVTAGPMHTLFVAQRGP
jgi:spermidine synthase